jgi:hypothetical protein
MSQDNPNHSIILAGKAGWPTVALRPVPRGQQHPRLASHDTITRAPVCNRPLILLATGDCAHRMFSGQNNQTIVCRGNT